MRWRRTVILGLVACAIATLAPVERARAAGELGFLSVSSTPSAKVLVDDQDLGLTTPVVKKALPVGAHRLTLVSGTVKRTLGFTINAGKETKLNINLGN
jgi:hypothetical protein